MVSLVITDADHTHILKSFNGLECHDCQAEPCLQNWKQDTEAALSLLRSLDPNDITKKLHLGFSALL